MLPGTINSNACCSANPNACPTLADEKVQISVEYFELREFVNLHETEVNPLVQILKQDPSVQIACDKLDMLLTEYIFDLAKDFIKG